jgi:hypothetical protein
VKLNLEKEAGLRILYKTDINSFYVLLRGFVLMHFPNSGQELKRQDR